MIQISPKPHKRKRFLENEKLASEARYWSHYKTSTSTFLEKCQPKYALSAKEKQRKKVMCVYFIRFRSITNPSYSFLKIGISNQKDFRFDFDSHRYTFQVLKMHRVSTRTQALKIEKHLLNKFSEYKHIPEIQLLSGGNSECFENSAKVEALIVTEFSNLNKLWMESDERTKIIEQRRKKSVVIINSFLGFSC